MKYPELQAREVGPFDDIEIPIYAQRGETAPLAIREQNRKAEQGINNARRIWQKGCIETLLTREDIGEAELAHLDDPDGQLRFLLAKLDVTKINLVRRPLLAQGLITPSLTPEKDAEGPTVKIDARHAGDLLTFTYDGITIGTFETAYDHSGKVGISVQVRDTD